MAEFSQLPRFDSPPVVETVLGVQFELVPEFNEPLAGWFWKKSLGPEWNRVALAPRLDDQFERFGDDKLWGPESFLTIRASSGERVQIFRDDNERMIQIQNTRFLFNWRKQSPAEYPTYTKLYPEFTTTLSKFEQFLKDNGTTKLTMNQWEVTYVNHISRGELWNTPDDWPGIFPWLTTPATTQTQRPDDFNGQWTLRIGDNFGRLHISLKHVRVGSIAGPEVLALQLTARGPVNDAVSLAHCLDLGHEAIVCSFVSMTSPLAQKHWKRIDNE